MRNSWLRVPYPSKSSFCVSSRCSIWNSCMNSFKVFSRITDNSFEIFFIAPETVSEISAGIYFRVRTSVPRITTGVLRITAEFLTRIHPWLCSWDPPRASAWFSSEFSVTILQEFPLCFLERFLLGFLQEFLQEIFRSSVNSTEHQNWVVYSCRSSLESFFKNFLW